MILIVNLSFASISECANRSNWIRQYKHWREEERGERIWIGIGIWTGSATGTATGTATETATETRIWIGIWIGIGKFMTYETPHS